jgi:hypothetical protein
MAPLQLSIPHPSNRNLDRRSSRPRATAAALSILAWMAGCAVPAEVQRPPVTTLRPTEAAGSALLRPCPPKLPEGTRCLSGRDDAGAFWWIAVPTPWSGVLVLHAHGGPELGPPKAERTQEDLQRWALMLRAGHAWAGSS